VSVVTGAGPKAALVFITGTATSVIRRFGIWLSFAIAATCAFTLQKNRLAGLLTTRSVTRTKVEPDGTVLPEYPADLAEDFDQMLDVEFAFFFET